MKTGATTGSWYATIGPGILLTATAVGAGDVLTSSLAGSEVGMKALWAAPAGVILKWFLSEGVARWQMATGTTLLEGWSQRLGGWIRWIFLVYLMLFTFVVGGALATACGVAGHGFLPLGDPQTSKTIWGVAHSLAGLAIVRFGGFRLFEAAMSVCIGFMFVSVVVTAALVQPNWASVAGGLAPSLPAQGTPWVIGIIGGIGGTLTLLSYGYWIGETGRKAKEGLRACRLDLLVSYVMTGLFGMGMVIIGTRVKVQGQGVDVALLLADQLAVALGPAGRYIFLLGFWGAVFSSILGVWQSLPYLFADFVHLSREAMPRSAEDLRRSRPYRLHQIALATVPLVLLWTPVKSIQLTFGILGAMFLPLLALTLLILNNNRRWVGEEFRSGWVTNAVLAVALLFFASVGGREIYGMLFAR